jgi:hypothetical protein
MTQRESIIETLRTFGWLGAVMTVLAVTWVGLSLSAAAVLWWVS